MTATSITRIELRVLRQVRSGYPQGMISPNVREKLRSMGLIEETDHGPIVTDEGLRRIETGRPKGRHRAEVSSGND
jgi:hypothetical protein